MIIYDLCCEDSHSFEGWFSSVDDYSRQSARGLLVCPVCESSQVRRVPSLTSFIGDLSRQEKTAPETATKAFRSESDTKNTGDSTLAPANSVVASDMPATNSPPTTSSLRFMLQQLTRVALSNSEDVGNDFAAEARRMHYSRSPVRNIHGQASDDEYHQLTDEGIAIVRLPVFNNEDLN